MTDRPRSLWPREHGAYAQLGAPLALALVLRMPTRSAIALACAAVLAFAANEPLLVVLGHRGSRARSTGRHRALRWLVITGSGAMALAAAGLAIGSPTTLAAAGLAAVPAAGVVGLALTRRQHSITGELVAAVALPGAAVPVAVASGLALDTAVVVWSAWSLGYACSVLAVHRVLARHRRGAAVVDRVLAIVLIAIAAGGGGVARWYPVVGAVVPFAAIAAALVVHPPRATRLRAVGVALVVASLASAAIIWGALR